MKTRTIVRTATALAAGAVLALAAPLAAGAHVSITPDSAAAGSYAVVTFKVPNESAAASTTTLTVTLPADTPFTSVRYVPVPGWTTELTTETLPAPVTVGDSEINEAVTAVTWTAGAGSEITAGQLQLFALSVGPVPDTGSIVLAADQTYSDGSVVSWSGTDEGAELSAPVLYVNDEAPSDGHGAAAPHDEEPAGPVDTGSDDAGASPKTDPAVDASGDTVARVFGVGGLVLGAVGLVLALRTRRRSLAQ